MPESIGQKLKAARESRRLSIEKAAEATRIRAPYLQALENDDYSVMVSAAQGRGFLRIYADFLGLDADQLTAGARDSKPAASSVPVADSASPAEPAPQESPAPVEEKPSRPGFWARILRRAPKEEPAPPAEQPAPEPAPEAPAPVPAASEIVEEPVQPAKKSTRKKAASTEDKPKPAPRKNAAGKKKTTDAVNEAAESQSIPQANPTTAQSYASLTELDEFQPEWWQRVRERAGLTSATAEPLDVTDEADEEWGEVAPVEESGRNGNRLSSNDMFALIGKQLMSRRQSLNLRREEIERHIRVRAHYLQALEEGNFEGLPSVVQTRGMLSNYATFLDLNVDGILLEFADVLQVRHRERHPLPPGAIGKVQPVVPPSVPPLRGFIVADLLSIGALILLLVFMVWGINRVMQTRAQLAVQPTSPSISDILLSVTAPPTLSAAATPGLLDLSKITETAAPVGQPIETSTFPPGVTVQINLVAVERTYLRVTVDGKVAFDGRTAPGTAYPFDGRERVEILAGNGAALRVTYNQRDLGLMGVYGQVINAVYTAAGIFNPTATISATPTITLTPSFTPSPTKTLVPSRTPTPP